MTLLSGDNFKYSARKPHLNFWFFNVSLFQSVTSNTWVGPPAKISVKKGQKSQHVNSQRASTSRTCLVRCSGSLEVNQSNHRPTE